MGSPRDFKRLLELVDQGALTPILDSVRPLSEAADAHRHLEAGRHFGKLVLTMS